MMLADPAPPGGASPATCHLFDFTEDGRHDAGRPRPPGGASPAACHLFDLIRDEPWTQGHFPGQVPIPSKCEQTSGADGVAARRRPHSPVPSACNRLQSAGTAPTLWPMRGPILSKCERVLGARESPTRQLPQQPHPHQMRTSNTHPGRPPLFRLPHTHTPNRCEQATGTHEGTPLQLPNPPSPTDENSRQAAGRAPARQLPAPPPEVLPHSLAPQTHTARRSGRVTVPRPREPERLSTN